MRFPDVNDTEIAFGIIPSKAMIQLAYANSFHEKTIYNEELTIRNGLKEEVKKMLRYLKAIMVSRLSKHEDKEAVCSMVLAEIFDVKESL